MKKFAALFVLFLASCLATLSVHAQSFEEGVHYEILSTPLTDKPEVTEYFSLYCSACYRFQSIAAELKSTFPKAFSLSHTTRLSPKPGMGEALTQAFALAQMLGKEHEFNQTMFERHFVTRNMTASIDDIQSAFADIGINQQQFTKGYNSFSVRARARQMQRAEKQHTITATPTLVINGKYKVLTNGFRDSNDLNADLIRLIEQLLERN